eukprot:1089357-Alexandrium_andersonii.AAC.1
MPTIGAALARWVGAPGGARRAPAGLQAQAASCGQLLSGPSDRSAWVESARVGAILGAVPSSHAELRSAG